MWRGVKGSSSRAGIGEGEGHRRNEDEKGSVPGSGANAGTHGLGLTRGSG